MPVQYDLVITGDRVIDPANRLNGDARFAVKGGKIAAVTESMPPPNVAKSVEPIRKFSCPDLIDMHVHVCERVTNFGLPADDAGIHSGTTTIIDEGSAGSRADIAMLDPGSGDWDLADTKGETLKVNERLVPALVYREGRAFIPNRRLLRDIYETDQRAPVLS